MEMIYISVDIEQLYQLLMSYEFEQVCKLAFIYVLSSKVLWHVPYILFVLHAIIYILVQRKRHVNGIYVYTVACGFIFILWVFSFNSMSKCVYVLWHLNSYAMLALCGVILPPMACKLMNHLCFLCGYLLFISCLGEGERGLKGERMAGGRAEILLASNGNILN